MRKDRIFDMLDNADDKTVDCLSVPALTEKEKERLLKMSKDKLDIMNEIFPFQIRNMQPFHKKIRFVLRKQY